MSRVIILCFKLNTTSESEVPTNSVFWFISRSYIIRTLLWSRSHHTCDVLLLRKIILRLLPGSASVDRCKPVFISRQILTDTNLYIYSALIHTTNTLTTFRFRKIDTRLRHSTSQIGKIRYILKLFCASLFNKLAEPAQTQTSGLGGLNPLFTHD